MKRFCVASLYTLVFALSLFCVKPFPVLAQQSAPAQWHQIRLHNVRPDMMAYFIDPEHQKEPLEFTIPSLNNPRYSSQDFVNVMKSGAPELTFDGILAADDKQNALWVFANQNTFDQTKRFVDFMDHPIPQCKLELQVVKVSKEDFKLFETKPIQFEIQPQSVWTNPPQHFPYKFSILTANSRMALLQKTLQQLISQGKAEVLNSPRITTLNHLTASLASATTNPILVGVKNNFNEVNKMPYVPFAFDATDGNQIGRTTQIRTAFTPDIDEATHTISVDLDISADEGISKYNTNPKPLFSKPIIPFSGLDQTIWFHNQLNPPLVARLNVDDNQIIVITGLDTTLLGFDKKRDNVALFLTVRIIHRAGS